MISTPMRLQNIRVKYIGDVCDFGSAWQLEGEWEMSTLFSSEYAKYF